MASASLAASSSDLFLLQSYPGSTSAASAAQAISRAVSCSLRGNLSPDTLAAARTALTALSENPVEAALPGLVDAVEKGADSSCVVAFVLTAGAWRAILGLVSVIRDATLASRVLSAAAVSALFVLGSGAEPKGAPAVRRLRIARFHATNGARCSRAFYAGGVRGSDATPFAAAAACDLFGAVAERIARDSEGNDGVRALAAPTAAFLSSTLCLLGIESWDKALQLPVNNAKNNSETVQRRTIVALYLVRCAHAAPPVDDFNATSKSALRRILLPFLFEIAETQTQCILQYRFASNAPSLMALLSASIANAAVQIDRESGADADNLLNFLLVRVTSESVLSSCLASRAIEALVAARGPDRARHAFAHVHEAFLLAKALQSPQADSRWTPVCRVVAQDLSARGLATGLPRKFAATCDMVQSDLDAVFSLAEKGTCASSESISRTKEVFSTHGNAVATQLLSRLERSTRSLSSPPPVLLARLAECALHASYGASIPRTAASVQHAAVLVHRFPQGVHRNALAARISAPYRCDRSLHWSAAGAQGVFGRLRETLMYLGKAAATGHKNIDISLDAQLGLEIENVLRVVQSVKSVLRIPGATSSTAL